jgi:hypothetical protein
LSFQINKIFISASRILFLLVIFILFVNQLSAQNDNYPVGARASAMANANIAESDVWSVSHNQAGLGFFRHFAIGFHHENKFVVPEYSLHAIALTLPGLKGTLGFSYSYFGYTKFNESKFGFAYGKAFGNKFAFGVQLNYHHTYLEGDYGNRNALSVEGGLQFKPTDKITFAAHVFNPSRATISESVLDTIPTILKVGSSIRPFEKIFVSVEAEKYLKEDVNIKSGLEYFLFESLFLRGGISTKPSTSTFGLGYKMKKLSADIAFTHHEILGFTPHFSMQIEFN